MRFFAAGTGELRCQAGPVKSARAMVNAGLPPRDGGKAVQMITIAHLSSTSAAIPLRLPARWSRK